MDARAKTVKEILYSNDQYLVPFFQRHYSWRRKHWERLWADLMALMEDDQTKSQHFLGPMVCTPTPHVPGEVTPYQLIDGQQRLTTLTILLTALRDICGEYTFTDLEEEITEDLLVHKRKKGSQRYKIVPHMGDRQILEGLIERKPKAEDGQEGIIRAHRLFEKRIRGLVENDGQQAQRLRDLLAAISDRLSLVVVTITGENPYEIFESLNSTGLPLEQADLVRNYLFMQIPLEAQESFNEEHWQPFESMFEEDGAYPAIPLTQFYRNYLMRNGGYSRKHATFVDFKEQHKSDSASPQQVVQELTRYAGYELRLRRPPTNSNEALRQSLEQFRQLETTTAHPLLMRLMAMRNDGAIDDATLLGCIQDIASFVLRRSICGESTRPYGRWFVSAIKEIGNDPRPNLQAYWFGRGWPDDETLIKHLKEFPLYRRERAKARLILEAVEHSAGHKEPVELKSETIEIEHVMPQSIGGDDSGKAWKAMLGEDWQAVHGRLLHTLGNLTLSGYNPNLSKKPFDKKRPILADSKLALNKYFASLSTWDGEAILARCEALATQIVKMWPRPTNGPKYVPSGTARPMRLSVAERRQACSRYWAAFVDAYRQRGINSKSPAAIDKVWTFKPPAVKARSYIYLRIPNRRLKCFLWINPQKRWIAAVITPKGKHKVERYNELLAKKSEIESALGQPLIWKANPQRRITHVGLWKFGSDPLNDDDWTTQHTWLLDNMAKLTTTFGMVQDTTEVEDSPNETRALYLKYWTRLQEVLKSSSTLSVTRKPRAQHWMTFKIGRSHFWLAVATSKVKKTAHVNLGIGGPRRDAFLQTLQQQKAEIEAVLGSDIEWRQLSEKKQNQIRQVFAEMDPANEADWPRQHDILRKALEAFHAALTQRVKDLHVEDDAEEDADS